MALQRGSLKHILFSHPVLSFHIAMAFVFNSFNFFNSFNS